MRSFLLMAAALAALITTSHANIDTLSDLANLATWSARVEVTRIVKLSTGAQQVTAKVLEQITGTPLGETIVIWVEASAATLLKDEGPSRLVLRPGEYLVFLEGSTDNGFTPCFGTWTGFAAIYDRAIHWRSKQLDLMELERIPRLGIGPSHASYRAVPIPPKLTNAEELARAIYFSDRPLPPASSEHYNEVITLFRNWAHRNSPMLGTTILSQQRALSILLRAGDQPTIEYFMEIYLQSRGKVSFATDLFRQTQQPLLIPHLVKALGDPHFAAQVVEEDVVYGSFPGMAARGILHVVSSSTAFPYVTRATASHYLQHPPTDQNLTAGLKDWWIENANDFAAGKYVKVTPLPEMEVSKLP